MRYVESIIAAIEAERREPDTWEALHLVYAIHAIVEERFYGALTFAEMSVIEPGAHRPPRLLPDGPEPVRLAHIEEALTLLKAKKMHKGLVKPGSASSHSSDDARRHGPAVSLRIAVR